MGCVDVKGLTVYGSPDEAARKVMAHIGAKHAGDLGWFLALSAGPGFGERGAGLVEVLR